MGLCPTRWIISNPDHSQGYDRNGANHATKRHEAGITIRPKFLNRVAMQRDRQQSGRGRNRALEHGLPGAGYSSSPQPRANDPGSVTGASFTIEMGTHQLDRRLPLASRRRPAKSEVATTPDRHCVARDPSLACNFLRTGHGPHIDKVDPDSLRLIGTAGDAVWANGEWSETIQDPNGGPIEVKGYWSSVHVREGDTWKIRLDTYNVTPAPAAAASPTASPSSQ